MSQVSEPVSFTVTTSGTYTYTREELQRAAQVLPAHPLMVMFPGRFLETAYGAADIATAVTKYLESER